MSIENRPGQLKGINLPQKVLRVGFAGLVVYGGYWGIDQGAKPVSASGPSGAGTPAAGFSPTSEKSPTPVKTAIIASVTPAVSKVATITGTPTKTLEQLRKELEEVKKNKEREKVQAEIDSLLGTPTKTVSINSSHTPTATRTATPTRTATSTATPTPTKTPDPDLLCLPRTEINEMIRDAKNEALRSIPTPTPRTVTVQQPSRGGGFDLGSALIGGVIGSIFTAVALNRRRVINRIRPALRHEPRRRA